MAENTKIGWTHNSFNPWWGCAKVSPGCDHCYAERDAGRFAPGKTLWGVDADRRVFGDKHWNEPLKWNKKAEKTGQRVLVFCASMADVFDKNAPEGARDRLWKLIKDTPFLTWQILTKRIGNAKHMLPADWGTGYPNVWLISSIVNQPEADRDIDKLLAIPAAVHGLSMEPLLGPVVLADRWLGRARSAQGQVVQMFKSPLDWIIVGGESGPKARPMHPAWARILRDQCLAAGVAFFFKQWGNWLPISEIGDTNHLYKPAPENEPEATRHCKVDSRPIGFDGGEHWGDEGGISYLTFNVGKKESGNLLDGVLYEQFPEVA